MRLSYLGRIVRLRPRALVGVLHLRKGPKRVPWINEVAKDCGRLKLHGALPASFPEFLSEPAAWHALIADERVWKNIVDELFFIESVTDRQVDSYCRQGRTLTHNCTRCTRAFASQKALESHCRTKHGDRLDIRRYIRTSVCPACGTDYRERLRCIAHLSDRRRPVCAGWVKHHVVPMAESQVKQLDEVDKVQRRAAWQAGHSTHIAKLPARRGDGRVVGRISA